MEWYELLLVFLAMGFLFVGVCGNGYCDEKGSAKQSQEGG